MLKVMEEFQNYIYLFMIYIHTYICCHVRGNKNILIRNSKIKINGF